jgi:hypothetical protein
MQDERSGAPNASTRRIDILPPVGEPQPLPAGANLPAIVARRRRANRIGWVALVATIAAIVVAGVVARDSIVGAWPPAARLYDVVGLGDQIREIEGLEFRNVASRRILEGGVPILVIQGEIQNITTARQLVPAIRVGLNDDNDMELHHWTFAADLAKLSAGDVTAFETRLTSPPAHASSLSVRFAGDGQS